MNKKEVFVGFVILAILSYTVLVIAQPTPHVVRGTIYDSSGGQVPNGITVTINDTISTDYRVTSTVGPSGFSGIYVTTISGTNGDLIVVMAWNETHWGDNNDSLLPTVTTIDVNMNRSRSSEPELTIDIPSNHTSYEMGTVFTINISITMRGNNGSFCNATISFSNPGVINLSQTETATHDLGDILYDETIEDAWDVSAAGIGATNITVVSMCDSDFFYLENINTDTVVNISVADTSAPIITLISPENVTRVNNPVTFYYNVTDGAPIQNCSLYINDVFQQDTTDPERNITLNFSQPVTTKYNLWYINCTESTIDQKLGHSGIFNLTINTVPGMEPTSVTNPINLLAGGTQIVQCNGTIYDDDGGVDITLVNATLFNTDLGQTYESPDNTSLHYTNSSCSLFNVGSSTVDFNCTFDMQYFALNGTWQCNVTALDLINATNSTLLNTTVNQLVALGTEVVGGAETTLIDYGNLGRGERSLQDIQVNVTNYGNIPLDLQLYGYAQELTDNLSMVCDQSNISVEYQRFEMTADLPYNFMTPLNASFDPNSVYFGLKPAVENITSSALTYWKLRIPTQNVSGVCNGRVVFTGIANP